MNQRFSRRTGLALAGSLLAAATAANVAAQSATPSPTVIPDLPQGPLGEQIQWFLDLMNGDPAAITAAMVGPHFSENALKVMSADDLAATLAEFATELSSISIEPGTLVTTRDMPPTNARFVIHDTDGNRLQVNLSVSSANGLIEGLTFSTAPGPVASPVASPVAAIPDLPQGPLGEQIQWLVGLLNGDPSAITAEEVEPHMAPVVLATATATDLAAVITDIAASIAPVSVEPATMVTTRDLPPTSAQFVLAGRDAVRLLTTVSVDGESGLMTGLYFQAAPAPDVPEASPAASPTA